MIIDHFSNMKEAWMHDVDPSLWDKVADSAADFVRPLPEELNKDFAFRHECYDVSGYFLNPRKDIEVALAELEEAESKRKSSKA